MSNRHENLSGCGLSQCKRIKLRSSSVCTAALLLLVYGGQEAQAQESQEAASKRIEEVVVTARKRSDVEAVQDVPTTITAISGQQVEALFAEDLVDIGKVAPNVVLTPNGNFPSSANFFIRGMGLFSSIPSDEPTVGIFADGMYLGVNLGSNPDFFDLEAIEILRGPQGTLFGRNVTGGAVLIRSRRPGDEFGFKARGTVGSEDRRDLSVAVDGPLTESGSLLGKLAVMHKDRDGYWDNPAIPGDTVGESESLLVRPMFTYRPTENFEATLITEFGDERSDGLPVRSLPYAVDPETTIAHDKASDFDTEWSHAILDLNWRVGPGKLTSISAYRQIEIAGEGDIDGSPATIFNISFGLDQDQLSQELRYAFEYGDGHELTTGLYYFEQEFVYTEGRDIFDGAVLQAAKGRIQHDALGVFAQTEYRLTDSISTSFGLRYTEEQKDATLASLQECSPDFSQCSFSFVDGNEWDFLSGHAGLQWFPAEDINVYGSWNRSFRSGGYNVRNASPAIPPGPYNEEQVDAFELGVKSDWLDGRLRLNGAIFRNEYEDLQRTVLDTNLAQRILNAADATIQGVELEVVALLSDNLSVQASLGYLDAEYGEFEGLDVDGDGQPDPQAAKELDIANVPEWTRYLGVTYELPLADNGTLVLQGSYSYTAESPANDANTIFVDAFELVDASVTWMSPGERFRVALFGKNLTNEVYARFAVTSSLFDFDYALPPRTWGLEFTYEY